VCCGREKAGSSSLSLLGMTRDDIRRKKRARLVFRALFAGEAKSQ
jgi:hypothetical protein